jgi:hypothetical protein
MATINGDCANGEIVSSTTTFSTCGGERTRAVLSTYLHARQAIRMQSTYLLLDLL